MKPTTLFKAILIATMLVAAFPAVAEVVSSDGESLASPQKNIKGVVLDEQGAAVAGAFVYVQGTSNGTMTDQNGAFELLGVDEGAAVTASCLGYNDITVSSVGKDFLTVTMTQNAEMLDEVIAIGYGSVRKSSLTGSISVVKGEELAGNPSINLQDALQGRAAGVYIDPSRQPGDGTTIRIRGVRSLNASNNPLLIVDGLPGSWENLNSNDVQSIEVLKDAAATAIYGSRAANGVILVTTKSARTDTKFSVELNSYVGVNRYKMIEMQSAEKYAEMIRDAKRFESYGTDLDKWKTSDIDTQTGLKMWDESWADNYYNKGTDFDWQNALLSKSSFTTGHTLSMGYHSDVLNYKFSYNYQDDNSYYKTVNYQRHILSSTMKFTPAKWVEFDQTTRLSYRKNSGNPGDTYNAIARMTPFETPYIDDDPAKGLKRTVGQEGYVNPLFDYEDGHYVDDKVNLMADVIFTGTVRPLSWLTFTSNLKLGFYEYSSGIYNDSESTAQGLGPNYAKYSKSATRHTTWNAILTADKEFGKHHITATAVAETIVNKEEGVWAESQGIAAAYMDYHFLNSGAENRDLGSSFEKYQLMSYLGRLQYSYADKYIVNAAVRYDGSSRLAEGNQWRLFPSVSAAWRISEEDFLKDNPVVSNLKLRLSYGEIGNQAIDPYQTLTTLKQGTYSWGNTGTYTWYPSVLANKTLGWEVSKTMNAGIDFGFLNNRIFGTVEYYDTRNEDLLMERSIPDVTGFTYIWQNIGSTRNHGIEFSLNATPVETKDFSWDLAFNIARNWNEITSLVDGSDIVDKKWFIGKPINVIYDYVFDGIWQLDEQDLAKTYKAEPGYIKVKNLDDSDEAITTSDKDVLGQTDPKWLTSFQSSFRYKGFDLSINFAGQFGHLITASNYVPKWNAQKWMSADVDWWTPLNPSNTWPRVQSSPDHSYADVLRYMKGDFIKIQNINLGYNFTKLAKNTKIGGLRVYLEGRNIAYLYKACAKDVNPEEANSVFTVPSTYVLGVNLTF